MKKLLLSLAAVAAVGATAAPAAAQSWGDYGHRDYGRYDRHDDNRLNTASVDGLDWKISNAAREGRISWDEARSLREQLRQVQPIAWRVQTGQASGWEAERLSRTVERIEAAVNRSARYGRYDRYDRRDRDDDRRDWR